MPPCRHSPPARADGNCPAPARFSGRRRNTTVGWKPLAVVVRFSDARSPRATRIQRPQLPVAGGRGRAGRLLDGRGHRGHPDRWLAHRSGAAGLRAGPRRLALAGARPGHRRAGRHTRPAAGRAAPVGCGPGHREGLADRGTRPRRAHAAAGRAAGAPRGVPRRAGRRRAAQRARRALVGATIVRPGCRHRARRRTVGRRAHRATRRHRWCGAERRCRRPSRDRRRPGVERRRRRESEPGRTSAWIASDRPVPLLAVAAGLALLLPWAWLGALGGLLETALALLAAAALGVLAATLLDATFWARFAVGRPPRPARLVLLGGLVAGVALLLLAAGTGQSGAQLPALLTLPPVGFALAALWAAAWRPSHRPGRRRTRRPDGDRLARGPGRARPAGLHRPGRDHPAAGRHPGHPVLGGGRRRRRARRRGPGRHRVRGAARPADGTHPEPPGRPRWRPWCCWWRSAWSTWVRASRACTASGCSWCCGRRPT